MSEKWRTAFKEIHGRTPSKQDYALAPTHVKEELGHLQENEEPIEEEGQPKKRSAVRLKRPAADDFSPYKPLPKRMTLDHQATVVESPSRGQSSSSRALFGTPTRNVPRTPTRLLLSASKPSSSVAHQLTPSQVLRTSPRKTPARLSVFDTPEKGQLSTFVPPSQALRTSPRKTPVRLSVFDTPEKGQLCGLAPALFGVTQSPKTPIRSPRKPCQKAIKIKNISSLLAPTPEKKQPEPEEEEPAFEPEDVPTTSKSRKTPAGGEAKVFDPTTGKVIRRAFKPSTAAPKPRRAPAEKGNFVRINMKKKAFTRGKVSAEAKRKLKRKQTWKRRFGGAK